MNWIDAVVIVVLIVYIMRGWRKGFLSVTFGLVALLISVIAAALVCRPFASVLERLGMSTNFARAFAFLIPFFIMQMIFWIISRRWFRRIPREAHRSKLNRVAGVIPALIEGLIMVGLVALLLVILPSRVVPHEAILDSKIARPLIDKAAIVAQHASNIFGGAIRDALGFITIRPEPTSDERIDLNYRTTDVKVNTTAEERMLVLINRERTRRGLVPLVADHEARAVARAHSKDMFARGYFSHMNPDGESPFDRMRNAGVSYITAGENLALAPTVEIAHEGLMNSPGHRANILSTQYRRVGIGAITSNIHGTMFTQIFRN